MPNLSSFDPAHAQELDVASGAVDENLKCESAPLGGRGRGEDDGEIAQNRPPGPWRQDIPERPADEREPFQERSGKMRCCGAKEQKQSIGDQGSRVSVRLATWGGT